MHASQLPSPAAASDQLPDDAAAACPYSVYQQVHIIKNARQ